ncbi:DUF930 domain-containing protein [Brucella sp. BE17]|uniref:DUF930 domain-containing protein n=1 Tax=Brucella sp. BE17 TaxID=3142977 RepID=UPI0031BA773C
MEMQDAMESASKEWKWGLAVSVLLHLAVAFLLIVRLPSLAEPLSEQAVNVELVPPEQLSPPKPEQDNPVPPPPPAQAKPQAFESALAEKQPEQELEKVGTGEEKPADDAGKPTEEQFEAQGGSAPSGTTDKQAKASAAEPENEKLSEARKLYSKDALADPRVKQALGRLPPQERIIQVCNIEALEQIRHHRSGTFPDMLARDRGSVSASGMTVSDGAFRSYGQWYAVDYKCEADTKTMEIVSFRYAVGAAIPRSEWARRQLPTD